VCASSDAEQLAEICDRVLVFARGRICREMTRPELTKDGIAEACYASINLSGGAEHYRPEARAG
jgi:ribose transport system ATP-binding protein